MRERFATALGAAVLALVYLLPFRAYGLNVDDEGTLLYELQRVLDGDLPYLGFRTGYTPGFFYTSAALWGLANDLPTFRALLACLHALTVAGLAFLLARRVRPMLALGVPLLYLAFIPLFPGDFCAFNVPYPAWFATAAWVATAVAMIAFVERRRRVWLVVAGLAAAAALSMKPNAGVFAIAAATAVVLAVEARPEEAGGSASALWFLLWAGVLGAVVAAFGVRVRAVDALVYLAPVVAALAALVTHARFRRSGLTGDVLALLLPFVLASLPWLAFFVHRLGREDFIREVLLIGSGAAELYYAPYPVFTPWALVVVALVLAGALSGALVRRGRLRPAVTVTAMLVAIGAALGAVLRLGLMPERLTWSIIWQLESAAFPLTLAAHVASVAWLWRRRHPPPAWAVVLLLFALFMHLQLYPRADFMHLVGAAPLTAVLAAVLLDRVLRWWEEGTAPAARHVVSLVTGSILIGAIVLRVSPGLAALAASPRFILPFAVAPVGVEREHAADLRDLASAATALGQAVGRGEPTLSFPAIDVVLVLTGTRNPTPYAYFYPGRPDHREEAEIVDTLTARPPTALASLNRHFTFFDSAPGYYFLLRRFVHERYTLAGRHGRFDVLASKGGPAPAPPGSPPGPAAEATERDAGRSLPDTPAALLDAATSDDASTRGAALAALFTATSESGRGLEDYVREAALDRRRQVLLLRTIRDARDVRAASYLFQATASGDRRLNNEALEAMARTRAELSARRHLWAGREEPRAWPARDSLVQALRTTLADRAAHPRAAAFAAYLAGVLLDQGSVPALRMRFAAGLPPAAWPRGGIGAAAAVTAATAGFPVSDGATTASAAQALAVLAPGGLACDLIALLGSTAVEIQEVVPTLLLELAEGDEPSRSEARTCLGESIMGAAPGREAAAWVAAVLADGALARPLRVALLAPEARVRRAAAWALGELPHDEASVAALTSAADADVDAIARRLAVDAAAKQRGARARAFGHTARGKGAA